MLVLDIVEVSSSSLDIPTKIYQGLISNSVAYKSFYACLTHSVLGRVGNFGKNGNISTPFATNLRQHEATYTA